MPLRRAALLGCATLIVRAGELHFPDAFSLPGQGFRVRADVELVSVPVCVIDRQDRAVANVRHERFRVFEDGREQQVAHVSKEQTPISVTLVVDVSGSMRSGLPLARTGAQLLLRSLDLADETSLITLRGRPEVNVGFGADSGAIHSAVWNTRAEGGTALADALMLAMRQVKQSRHRQRAIVVFSDGGDRDSRYRWPEVRRVSREADAAVYFFALPGPAEPEELEFDRAGQLELRAISRETGGRSFAIDGIARLTDAVAKLDLHWRYLVGYYPENRERDGRYRRVDVRLAGGGSELRLFWRRGYTASQ